MVRFFWRVSKIDHDLRQGFSQQKMVVSKHFDWFWIKKNVDFMGTIWLYGIHNNIVSSKAKHVFCSEFSPIWYFTIYHDFSKVEIWTCGGKSAFFYGLPSGKLTYLWKITIFNGKIHYKCSFSIAMLNYQRVSFFYAFFAFFELPIFQGSTFLDAEKTLTKNTVLFIKTITGFHWENSCKKIVVQGKFGFSWAKHMMFHWENSSIIEKIKYFMVKQKTVLWLVFSVDCFQRKWEDYTKQKAKPWWDNTGFTRRVSTKHMMSLCDHFHFWNKNLTC